jgi:hypothetical protein
MNPDLVDAWSKFVPLAQTAVWAAIAIACVLAVRPQLIAIAEVIAQRLSGGAELATPWLSLKGMPAAVRTPEPTGVTSEGASGAELTPDVDKLLTSKEYPAFVDRFVPSVNGRKRYLLSKLTGEVWSRAE